MHLPSQYLLPACNAFQLILGSLGIKDVSSFKLNSEAALATEVGVIVSFSIWSPI